MTTTKTMTSHEAIEILMDFASRFGENAEEAFPRRITADDTDEAIEQLAQGSVDFEPDEVREIRDLWRAVNVAQSILDQRGCEHFDKAGDGSLTDLMDIVIYG